LYVKVAVMDFGGAMIRLKLRRRPGYDNTVDVLELPDHPTDAAAAAAAAVVPHDAESPSLWGRVTGIFGGAADTGVVSHGNDQVCATRVEENFSEPPSLAP